MPNTATTKQGFEVDASIVEFISHLNDCGWIKTSESCSGVRSDHDGEFHLPYLGFYSKNEGRYNENPATEDIELQHAIESAGWFQSLHFMMPYALAYPRFISHASSTSENNRTSNLRIDYIAKAFAHAIEDTPDEEKIDKWKDLVAAISMKFCPEKNPFPNREIP
ncbi:MAG: hypothetical protein ACTSPB_20150, partial [Candidatus Thorarchaeota archaeon]